MIGLTTSSWAMCAPRTPSGFCLLGHGPTGRLHAGYLRDRGREPVHPVPRRLCVHDDGDHHCVQPRPVRGGWLGGVHGLPRRLLLPPVCGAE